MSSPPLDQLIDAVDPRGCHVINFPKRIWVFGGPINPESDRSEKSQRDSFWRQTIRTSDSRPWFVDLDRPEDHPEWWAFSGYDDLLEFERDACYLSHRVVLFSESPGSHAELGALALDDWIVQKLIVVVQSKYLEEGLRESFLNLGPIKRTGSCGTTCVIGSAESLVLSLDDFETILDSIDRSLEQRPHSSSVLQPKNATHQLLLVADLVELLLVARTDDLEVALPHFGVHLDQVTINRYLNLLDFFGFIKCEIRGNEPFWVRRIGSDAPWVNYTAKPDRAGFDRSRFKVSCQESIDRDKGKRTVLRRSA